MESPYKFEDPARPRIVTNLKKEHAQVYGLTAVIYSRAMFLYHRRYLRHNPNGMLGIIYGTLFLSASYGIANTILSSSSIEAAERNNRAEDPNY